MLITSGGLAHQKLGAALFLTTDVSSALRVGRVAGEHPSFELVKCIATTPSFIIALSAHSFATF
jgi:hypothetical protein